VAGELLKHKERLAFEKLEGRHRGHHPPKRLHRGRDGPGAE